MGTWRCSPRNTVRFQAGKTKKQIQLGTTTKTSETCHLSLLQNVERRFTIIESQFPKHVMSIYWVLVPHERLPELPVIPREKPHTGATARENPRDATVIARLGTSFPAWPGEQSLVLSPNFTGGFTPFRPLNGLQEIPVATREESGVFGFPSRRGLTPRVSL